MKINRLTLVHAISVGKHLESAFNSVAYNLDFEAGVVTIQCKCHGDTSLVPFSAVKFLVPDVTSHSTPEQPKKK